jgi:truncated hemoglobin YjbI
MNSGTVTIRDHLLSSSASASSLPLSPRSPLASPRGGGRIGRYLFSAFQRKSEPKSGADLYKRISQHGRFAEAVNVFHSLVANDESVAIFMGSVAAATQEKLLIKSFLELILNGPMNGGGWRFSDATASRRRFLQEHKVTEQHFRILLELLRTALERVHVDRQDVRCAGVVCGARCRPTDAVPPRTWSPD